MAAELPATVPGPVPPDDREAWYAPDIRAQYRVAPGVVATITETADGFRYRTREPPLAVRERAVRETIVDRFDGSTISRPRTRDGAIDRMNRGLPEHWEPALGPLDGLPPGARRRVEYHLGAAIRALGALTSLALDERIRIGDTTSERLTVHTAEFAPALTDLPAETPHLDSFLSERVSRESVTFEGFDIPVTTVRRHLLGADTFDKTYVIEEPDRLPGDDELLSAVKDRLLESPPSDVLDDESAYVRDRARTLLRRRLALRDTSRLLDSLPDAVGNLLKRIGLGGVPRIPREERVESLSYYVIRDLIGEGALTIPMRDARIRSIEASRVGERVAVEPHRGTDLGGDRLPTSVSIDDEDRFVGLARRLAAEGGVELNARTPSATVTLERPTGDTEQDVYCAVSLPTGADDGPHISLRKRRATAQSPVELVDRGVLTPEIVAVIWTVAVNRGRIVFVGPSDGEPEAVLSAHTPFIPSTARPVALESAGSQIDLPHETALTVSLESPGEQKPVTAESTARQAVLDPDVAVLPDLTAPGAFPRFESLLAAGTGLMAAAPMVSREIFATNGLDAGLVPSVLAYIDLVVELPAAESAESATGWVPTAPERTDTEGSGDWTETPTITWERALESDSAGSNALTGTMREELTEDIEARESDPATAFRRRTRYVSYLHREGRQDRSELMAFLTDLRTDEAATVERIQRTIDG